MICCARFIHVAKVLIVLPFTLLLRASNRKVTILIILEEINHTDIVYSRTLCNICINRYILAHTQPLVHELQCIVLYYIVQDVVRI